MSVDDTGTWSAMRRRVRPLTTASEADGVVRNAFTVDLEEWFHGLTSTNREIDRWHAYESRVVPATRRLLQLLATHDTQATFFVLGRVAVDHPDLVAEIAAAGHEIGVHGYDHRFVHQLTPAAFAAELERAVEAIVTITGEMPAGHRAPYFSINAASAWAFDILLRAGFRYDSSVFPTRSLIYGFPEAPPRPFWLRPVADVSAELAVFPATTIDVGPVRFPAIGGFYTRAVPLAATERVIRRLNRDGRPAILYIHPWELDLEQPIVAATPRERITHYFGRRTLPDKLSHLLAHYAFQPLGAFLNMKDAEWQTTPV